MELQFLLISGIIWLVTVIVLFFSSRTILGYREPEEKSDYSIVYWFSWFLAVLSIVLTILFLGKKSYQGRITVSVLAGGYAFSIFIAAILYRITHNKKPLSIPKMIGISLLVSTLHTGWAVGLIIWAIVRYFGWFFRGW
ncbi:MAG: hypothetical protein ACYS8W_20415 [Planctomycetota bacterium]|jgi:hypothetical protein